MNKIPQKIKDYTVGKKIGNGAYGSVFFAERSGQKYAIKFEPREQTELGIETEVSNTSEANDFTDVFNIYFLKGV